MKDVRNQGVEGLSSADKGEGCSSDTVVCTFCRKKIRIFCNLWCVHTDKRGGGIKQCGHFANRGSQFFAILCGRLLWTAPNRKIFGAAPQHATFCYIAFFNTKIVKSIDKYSITLTVSLKLDPCSCIKVHYRDLLLNTK